MTPPVSIALSGLVDQRHRDQNGVVDIIVGEPLVRLLLEAPSPWAFE